MILIFSSTILAPTLSIGTEAAELKGMPQSTKWQKTDEAAARLVAEQANISFDGKLWLGLQIRLSSGWKTYWREPGESGVPPRLDWSDSHNLENAQVYWPAPERFSYFGLQSFGYKDEVVLPILLKTTSPLNNAIVRLKLDYMICAHLCIPIRTAFTLKIQAYSARIRPKNNFFSALIKHYQKRIPKKLSIGNLRIESAQINEINGITSLRIKANSKIPFTSPDLIVEGPRPFRFGKPTISFNAKRHEVTMVINSVPKSQEDHPLKKKFRLTLIDRDRAVEKEISATQKCISKPFF